MRTQDDDGRIAAGGVDHDGAVDHDGGVDHGCPARGRRRCRRRRRLSNGAHRRPPPDSGRATTADMRRSGRAWPCALEATARGAEPAGRTPAGPLVSSRSCPIIDVMSGDLESPNRTGDFPTPAPPTSSAANPVTPPLASVRPVSRCVASLRCRPATSPALLAPRPCRTAGRAREGRAIRVLAPLTGGPRPRFVTVTHPPARPRPG